MWNLSGKPKVGEEIVVGNPWECEVRSRIWKQNKHTFRYIVTIYFLRPLKFMSQCVERFLHTFWAVRSCAGPAAVSPDRQHVFSCLRPHHDAAAPGNPSMEMAPAHTNTLQPAAQLLAVLSPGQMQQGLCLEDDRAHLNCLLKRGSWRGTNTGVQRGRWLHGSLLNQGSPLSSNDNTVRGQQTSKDHMDIVGPCSHSFLLHLVLSWMCLCVCGGGYRRAKVWVKVLRVSSAEQLEASPDELGDLTVLFQP